MARPTRGRPPARPPATPAVHTKKHADALGYPPPRPPAGRPADETGVTEQEAPGTSAARPISKREPAGQPADAKDTE